MGAIFSGWGAKTALAFGLLGTIAFIVAFATEKKTRFAFSIVALACAFFAASAGVLGMGSIRRSTERGIVDMGGTRALTTALRYWGYEDARRTARVGFGASLLPLLVGGAIAIVLAKRREGSRGLAAAASAIALLTSAGALASSMGPLPPSEPTFRDELLDARDLVGAGETYNGCEALDRSVARHCHPDPHAWPRVLDPDPRKALPDFDMLATRCVRNAFENVTNGGQHSERLGRAMTLADLLESPLLVDEELRGEIRYYEKPEFVWNSDGDIGDWLSLHGRVDEVSLAIDRGDLPKLVVQRVMRKNWNRFMLCYEDGWKKNASLAGEVKIELLVALGGVLAVRDEGSSLADRSVVECVVQAAQKSQFPAPEKETVAHETLSFKPKR